MLFENALVLPDTLTVTHISDGQEVVTGGDDGQVWVATFANQRTAQYFVRQMKYMNAAVFGQRKADAATEGHK